MTSLLVWAPALGLCVATYGSAAAAPPELTEADDTEADQAAIADIEAAPEPEPEPDPEPSTAVEWYARGIELGNAGDFFGAASAFLQSYELQPTSEALFNAGFAYQNAGVPISAIETYRRFLAEPKRNEDLARAAQRSIDVLMREVAVLKGVRYAPGDPPAELYVGGERREIEELPLLLSPGPVIIEVVSERGDRAHETYEIAAGEALVIDLRALLQPVRPLEINDTDVEQKPTPSQLEATRLRARRALGLRRATWVGLGLTGAAGVSLGVFAGLMTRERQSYLDTTCLEEVLNGTCPAGFMPGDPEGHMRVFERYRLGTTITAGVTGGLALGTLVVALVGLRLERRPGRGKARVQLAPSPGGFALKF